ncbi:helix-turn-helix domain-containing protein [Haloprofundus halobius]|uniref:helix-turn-helix domain-containing protein n=1 Tax=Haloprofundus halobius TaxID=2876194 RepID=UPI001CCFDB52|nr:helix-turn-helix domain-containing protein [Haloprofundus halobius]
MVNREFTPTENQEDVLSVFKLNREENEPWGYANPMRIRLETGLKKQRVNDALKSLIAAGWVEQVQVEGQSVRGLYRFVEDPREQ